jgi:phenylpropionate dioxygenase-like ring-hydroxylating dioxygenase large terminal subunit
MARSLLTDGFFESFESSVIALEAAESLPPACYVDEEFFGFEKETMFFKEWLCVGRESWLKEPGSYFTSQHVGEPLVITRTKDGEIAALSAVCQHRGMLVAEGRGRVQSLVCPYHHWVYSLTGKLVGAPAMEKTCNFQMGSHSLPRLRVETWQGFIFVNFDENAPPLGPRLAALDEIVAHYGLADLDGPPPPPANRYNWNWKVMFENNNDGYHANKLHRGPLHDFIPSNLATFPELPGDTAGYYRTNGSLHIDASFNPTTKALLPVFPNLTQEERHRVLFVNVPPSLSLVMNADMVLFLILQAESADWHTLEMGTLVAPGAMDDPMFERLLKVNEDSVAEIVTQDLHVDLLVQQGLKSKFAPRGRYSWQEGAQRQFNLWLVDRYKKAWADKKAKHVQ